METKLDRRNFMRRTALTVAGAGLAVSGVQRKILGANDKIVVGVIGTGRMGRINLEDFAKQPDVEIAAVCDVYEPNLNEAVKLTARTAKTYHDFREILDRKDIDAVIISTPDHWHALQTVLACKAGKDVYVEKPISVAVEEGRRMVEAARKYSRVVQVGTMQRSGTHFQKAAQLIEQGLMGKISFVRSWVYVNEYPNGMGNPSDQEPPAGLDWDLWLGPAPKVLFNWNRFGVGPDKWSTFRFFWDYAGGHMTDWGAHLIDVVQWAMKVDGPTAVTASGGKFFLKDNRDTPDTIQVTFDYPGFVCTFENRLCNANSMWGKWYGMEFHGTDATLFVDRSGFEVFPEKQQSGVIGSTSAAWGGIKKEVDRTATMKMDVANDPHLEHVRNFLDCIKSRQRPTSDIETGHHSITACHLGNIAYRSKERLAWDVATERLTQGSPAAQNLLGREYRAPWKLVV
jgi:predicted dehydrogenase